MCIWTVYTYICICISTYSTPHIEYISTSLYIYMETHINLKLISIVTYWREREKFGNAGEVKGIRFNLYLHAYKKTFWAVRLYHLNQKKNFIAWLFKYGKRLHIKIIVTKLVLNKIRNWRYFQVLQITASQGKVDKAQKGQSAHTRCKGLCSPSGSSRCSSLPSLFISYLALKRHIQPLTQMETALSSHLAVHVLNQGSWDDHTIL